METYEQHGVAFVSVTQQLNSASSMGRLALNVLLSFAQFERELIAERTRDKVSASWQTKTPSRCQRVRRRHDSVPAARDE